MNTSPSYVLPKILELRLANNYTQKYVANVIGVSLNKYVKIEEVSSNIIRMNSLEKLAKLYNTTIADITGWDK